MKRKREWWLENVENCTGNFFKYLTQIKSESFELSVVSMTTYLILPGESENVTEEQLKSIFYEYYGQPWLGEIYQKIAKLSLSQYMYPRWTVFEIWPH